MSRKEILPVYHVIEDGYMAADITSDPTSVKNIDRVIVQLIWTGTPTGIFSIQTSLNYNPPLVDEDAATWTAFALNPTPTAAGSADNWVIDLTETGARWLRIVYDASSGSGTLQAYISGKSSGG